jgi:hypothetical protein
MTGYDVLRAAADRPVDDEYYRAETRTWTAKWDGQVRDGGGLVMALKTAAGSDLAAYQEAQGILDNYLDPIVPLNTQFATPQQRGRQFGAIREWAIGKSDDERRALLREMAERYQ